MLWALAFGALVGFLLVASLTEPIPGLKSDISPHGLLDWELAFTRARAEGILTAWSRYVASEEIVQALLGRNRLLLVLYGLALTVLCLLVVAALRTGRRKAWALVACLPTLAVVFYWLEERLLLRQLTGDFGQVLWASLAATVKLSALVVPSLALVVVGIARLRKLQSVSRAQPAHPLREVVEAERRYLQQRRRLAGLRQREFDVGLALSGGGLRSATISLGVLQAFAEQRVLRNFDYLSTVSGGGYIGAALSSLLSVNGSRLSSSPRGEESQYLFEDGDEPWFSTNPERFPFNELSETGLRAAGGFDGAAQVKHLRLAGEHLIGSGRLLSTDMLRTVGAVLGGIFYHLLHFGLIMVSVSAGYLWLVYLMVGDRATRFAPHLAAGQALGTGEAVVAIPLQEQHGQLAREAFGLLHAGVWWQHPLLISAALGFAAMLVGLLGVPRLLEALPGAWFQRPRRSAERSRNEDSLFAMVMFMLALGAALTTWFLASGESLLNLSIPLFCYLGGGLCLLLVHGLVAMSHRLRPIRSYVAVQAGAVVYLILLSLVLVSLILVFLAFFEPLSAYVSARPVASLFGWLLALVVGLWLLGLEAGRKGIIGRLLAVLPSLRRLVVVAVVVAAVAGSLVHIWVTIWRLEPAGSPGGFRFMVCLVALAMFLFTGLLDFNRLSLHFYYRDLLADAYLQTTASDPSGWQAMQLLRDNENLRLEHLHGSAASGAAAQCVTSAPYHLVVTCLNLTQGRRRRQTIRRTDQFIFSKLFCGSELTGFVETGVYRLGKTELADAMTISGAAVSSALSAAVAILNLRLGRWMENPSSPAGTRIRRTFWAPYLFRELVASTDADHRLVYLSDGGYTGDNLGICPLLKRRCTMIVAVDAECDPDFLCDSLCSAIRQIQVDEGITIDIDLGPLRPRADRGYSLTHWVEAPIRYPATEEAAESRGWLWVLKSSLTGDEPAVIENYKARHWEFPHQSTADLSFDWEQFESYRWLGSHLGEQLVDIVLRRVWADDLLGPGKAQGKGS